MKHSKLVLLAIGLVSLLAYFVSAQNSAAPARAAHAFDKLKTLAGDWQGTGSDGKMRTVSYQLAAGGTALVETLTPEGEPSMVSLYHRDGETLMMTHYCSASNQPRMRAEIPPGDLNTLEFVFVDVTNLAKPTDGHIHGLTLTLEDADHLAQTWTWRENGKEVSDTFTLSRKK